MLETPSHAGLVKPISNTGGLAGVYYYIHTPDGVINKYLPMSLSFSRFNLSWVVCRGHLSAYLRHSNSPVGCIARAVFSERRTYIPWGMCSL